MLTYSTLSPLPVLTTYLSSLHPASFFALLGTHHVGKLCLLAHQNLLYAAPLLLSISLETLTSLPLLESSLWWDDWDLFPVFSDLIFTLLLEDFFFPACSVSHLAPRACSFSNPSSSCSELDMWPPHLSSWVSFLLILRGFIKVSGSYCKLFDLSTN